MVVEEGDQDRLAAGDDGAVQRVPDPTNPGRVGLEPAERRQRPAVGVGPGQPRGCEVTLQGPSRRRVAAVRGQDHRDLRRGRPAQIYVDYADLVIMPTPPRVALSGRESALIRSA